MDQSVIDRYRQLNWEELLRKDMGPSGDLSLAEPNFKRIKDIFDQILSYLDELVSQPDWGSQVQSEIDSFIVFCTNHILGDSYTDVTQRNQKISDIRQRENNIRNQLISNIQYFQFIQNNNQSDVKLKNFNKKLEKMIQTQDELQGKIKEGEIRYNNLVKEEEILPFGKEFLSLATENKKNADINLIFMFVSLLVTLGLAIYFLFKPTGNAQQVVNIWDYLITENILPQIFILSVGGYIIAHFSRNYSAEMNMYYQNKHRQISLNSHKRIIESVESTDNDNAKEVRNTILLQVTKTMYEIRDSGYLKKTNNPMPATQIVENIRLK